MSTFYGQVVGYFKIFSVGDKHSICNKVAVIKHNQIFIVLLLFSPVTNNDIIF